MPTYGLMLLLAIVTAMFVMDRAFKRAHLTADAVEMIAVAALAGMVGSKIWYLVLDSPGDFRAMGWRALLQNVGFSWFGALASESCAGAARQEGKNRRSAHAGFGCSLRRHRPGLGAHRVFSFRRRLLRHCDPAGPLLALRFIRGVWPSRMGLSRFLFRSTPRRSMSWPRPGHWRVAVVAPRQPHATGAIMGQYLILAGTARFLVEFIRRNPKVLWGLSNEQLTSAGAVVRRCAHLVGSHAACA